MPTSANVMATADAGPSSVKGAPERHTTAVIPEAVTSAGTRNQNPSRSPTELVAAKAHNIASSPPKLSPRGPGAEHTPPDTRPCGRRLRSNWLAHDQSHFADARKSVGSTAP